MGLFGLRALYFERHNGRKGKALVKGLRGLLGEGDGDFLVMSGRDGIEYVVGDGVVEYPEAMNIE